MSTATKRWLYWSPRVLGILFAVFISLFALDVWDMPGTFWERLGGFLIHLIPTYIVIAVLLLAWRWEWVGALVFAGLGVLYIVWSWGSFHWSAPASISGPLFVVAILFLLNWIHRRELRSR